MDGHRQKRKYFGAVERDEGYYLSALRPFDRGLYEQFLEEIFDKFVSRICDHIAHILETKKASSDATVLWLRREYGKEVQAVTRTKLSRINDSVDYDDFKWASDRDHSFSVKMNDWCHTAGLIARVYIDPTKQIYDEVPSIEVRLSQLGEFARQNKGIGVEDFARRIFPELTEGVDRPVGQNTLLPTVAPEKYQGLRGPETPPAFVQRVYGEWLGHGLTRAHIRKLDAKLYEGINNWLSRPGNQWPAEVDLPTLKEQNDRDWAAMNSPENRELLGKFTGKEAARISAAVSRRTKQ